MIKALNKLILFSFFLMISPSFAMDKETETALIPSLKRQLRDIRKRIEAPEPPSSIIMVLGAEAERSLNWESHEFYFGRKTNQLHLYVDPENHFKVHHGENTTFCIKASINNEEELQLLSKCLRGELNGLIVDPKNFTCSEDRIRYPELVFSMLHPSWGKFYFTPYKEPVPKQQFDINAELSIKYYGVLEKSSWFEDYLFRNYADNLYMYKPTSDFLKKYFEEVMMYRPFMREPIFRGKIIIPPAKL